MCKTHPRATSEEIGVQKLPDWAMKSTTRDQGAPKVPCGLDARDGQPQQGVCGNQKPLSIKEVQRVVDNGDVTRGSSRGPSVLWATARKQTRGEGHARLFSAHVG